MYAIIKNFVLKFQIGNYITIPNSILKTITNIIPSLNLNNNSRGKYLNLN